MEVQQQDNDDAGMFYIEKENSKIGMMTYRRLGNGNLLIDHTEVDSEMEGLGLGEKMVKQAVLFARENKIKTCNGTMYYKTFFMHKDDVTKTYSNVEITIVWQAAKCIHSGICVKMLPQVYNPKERPWIKPENAPTEALIKQVAACPSGALSYFMKDAENIQML
jgi:uncharacterized Fe-S cluster protein YjdI